MSAWRNPVRARLEAGESVYAITLTTNNLETAALAATLGFHFLWVEMEHSPITLETLRGIVLATRGLPAMVFARVPVIESWTAKRVMDQGVSGVIFPFCSTPELAHTAAQSCKYPPHGRRGSGAGLATACWPEPGSYYDSSDSNMLVIAMIEEQSAVERIDEIAATPGIDVLFIGTSDLSFSMGMRGRQDDPALHRSIERIVEAARKHGKFIGRPAGTPEQVREFQQQGFQMFQGTTDLNLMAAGARQYLDPLGISGIPREQKALY